MKPSFVLLSIALLLLSFSDASDYVSPVQSPVMSPTSAPTNSDCSSVIYSMVDCMSFLTVGSTDHNPTKPCCVGIKTVLEYNAQCLCSALESSRSMGFDIDDSKALALPSVCHVPIIPHCDVTTAPTSPPVSPSVKPPKSSPSSTKFPAKTSPISEKSPAKTSPSSIKSPTKTSPSSTKSPASTPSLSRGHSTTITDTIPKRTASPPKANSLTTSKSCSVNLLASKIFLLALIISSFVFISI